MLLSLLLLIPFAGTLALLVWPGNPSPSRLRLISIAILVRDGRPILYSDRRAGLFGRPFVVHKFRTMRVGAEESMRTRAL
mgnify:CR=1 FL=1